MNDAIFKAYDIRGIYPEELNEDLAYRIGLAFAHYTNAKKILVAEDARVSTEQLKKSLLKGLTANGADVFLAGQATTPIFYFAVANGSYDAGIMITASHNPGKYNGFKMVRGNAMPIGQGSGMEEIKNLALRGELETSKSGNINEVEIKEPYIKKLFELLPTEKIKDLKIAIDAGNGMAGIILPKILEKLPQVKVEKLFFDVDMSFPNHEANPLKEETLSELKNKVAGIGADIGIAYDGDADRIGFVDELGEFARADYVLALILPIIFELYPGATILYDLRCSKIVAEEARQLGGNSQMTRVGHAFIKKQMKDTSAVVAAELSSHFYFKDFYGVECSDLVMLYMLTLLSRSEKKFSELVAPLKKYFQSGEINFEIENKEEKIKELAEKYKPLSSTFTDIDGIRADFEKDDAWWWFNVRASNTEPMLRLNVEASNKKLLEEKLSELNMIIREHS